MDKTSKLKAPEITATYKSHIIKVPELIAEKTSGIIISGKKIQSILFTTDIAIIENSNADSIIAVYPFTPHPSITQAILNVSDVPVFCGVGGGVTSGVRSVNISLHAEFQGACAVVLNAPTPLETITEVAKTVDIPVVITIVSEFTDVAQKINAGARIINVSGGAKTTHIVREIRKNYPEIPIIATGGPTTQSIQETIDAGANAITWTPPTSAELFKISMEKYRKIEEK